MSTDSTARALANSADKQRMSCVGANDSPNNASRSDESVRLVSQYVKYSLDIAGIPAKK
jgi:hypothetical protein